MILIPAIDIQDGRCVRLTQGVQGTTAVYSEQPAEVARRWAAAGARLIHVVDLDGAFAGAPKNRTLIQAIIAETSTPIEVAGGIRDQKHIDSYIESGANRVVLGTKVVDEPKFLQNAIARYGARIWVGIDARDGRVMVRGWTEAAGGRNALELAQEVARLGIGGIIFTDISRDGMLTGPNLDALTGLLEAVEVPVVASGGVASLDDLRALAALAGGRLHGAIIGKALYSGRVDFAAAVAELQDAR
jgi:phosphoribosylformimino-5-aminoimidazole carboxamide ribotide isomerase